LEAGPSRQAFPSAIAFEKSVLIAIFNGSKPRGDCAGEGDSSTVSIFNLNREPALSGGDIGSSSTKVLPSKWAFSVTVPIF